MSIALPQKERGLAFCYRSRCKKVPIHTATPGSPSITVSKNSYFKQRNNAMTSAALSPVITTTTPLPQIEPANFLNLLIVDDERSIREACREIAQSLGYSAQIADSAEQAFRA